MTGAGTLYPFFVSVMGLTERELPGKDFVVAKIPGFCLGGSGVDVGNKRPGYICFMKDTPGAKTERCRWYLRHVFIPTLNEHREIIDKFDRSLSSTIPPKLRCVSSLDP